MKITNIGLLSATWVSISVAYLASVLAHVFHAGVSSDHGLTPGCIRSHIFEDLPIPVAAIFAALFLNRGWIWPRVILGLASGVVLFFLFGTSIPLHPYPTNAGIIAVCVWTIFSVLRHRNWTEHVVGGNGG